MKNRLSEINQRMAEINQILRNNERAGCSLLDRDDVEDLEKELNALNQETQEIEKSIKEK